MKLNVLCIGDIVGRPGRRVLADKLRELVEEHSIDCVIANAENVAGGSGITPQIYDKLGKYGVNLITLGDHAYRKREIISTLETADNITRPANLSSFAAGKDYALYQTSKGPVVAVGCVIGRIYMKPANCPFEALDRMLPAMKKHAELTFIDVHAEATSEKVAIGRYLDGKVTCVFGTHTHINTADETILPNSTAYITDIGMTGPHDSVLGRKTESVIKAMRTQMPYPFEVATDDVKINGIVVTADNNSRKAESIRRISVSFTDSDSANYDSDDGKAAPPSII